MTGVCLLWAQSPSGVIGAAGALPWHLPEDLRLFRALTTGGVVVMGRHTWESLPARFRPLPGRRNLVLSRRPGWSAEGAEVLDRPVDLPALEQVWVIGGEQVYAAFEAAATVAVTTTVQVDVAGDAYAPTLGPDWRPVLRSGVRTSRTGLRYEVQVRVRTDSAPGSDGGVDRGPDTAADTGTGWFGTLLATVADPPSSGAPRTA